MVCAFLTNLCGISTAIEKRLLLYSSFSVDFFSKSNFSINDVLKKVFWLYWIWEWQEAFILKIKWPIRNTIKYICFYQWMKNSEWWRQTKSIKLRLKSLDAANVVASLISTENSFNFSAKWIRRDIQVSDTKNALEPRFEFECKYWS